MSRSYRSVRPKLNWIYASEEVLELYGISANTLSNWIKAGLRIIPGFKLNLFRGDELVWFHRMRALPKQEKKRVAEFDCYKCKLRVLPRIETLNFTEVPRLEASLSWVHASCPNCATSMQKFLNKTDCNKLRECVETNTSLLSLDEADMAVPADIAIKSQIPHPEWNETNELIIYEYQILIGGSAPKTARAILATIRFFEKHLDFKSFSKLKRSDVAVFRDHLLSIGFGKSDERRSRSTIRLHAAHLREFLRWLVLQDGYRRLDRTLCDYIHLPRSQSGNAFQPEPRPIMSQAELELILQSHPSATRINRRDRAIIASSFLFGTRSDTTASLRVGDVDVENRLLQVNADNVRVKGHTSMLICWFPIHKLLETFVIAWVQELDAIRAKPGDALFPPDEWLLQKDLSSRSDEQVIPTWKTDEPVRRAFRNACSYSGVSYFNPHSAKHYKSCRRKGLPYPSGSKGMVPQHGTQERTNY